MARAAACAAVARSAARGKAQSSVHRALSASEPCLLMSCWPKQGRGPSPESVERPWPRPVTCRETHACPPVAVGCVHLGSGGESGATVTVAFTLLQLAGWLLAALEMARSLGSPLAVVLHLLRCHRLQGQVYRGVLLPDHSPVRHRNGSQSVPLRTDVRAISRHPGPRRGTYQTGRVMEAPESLRSRMRDPAAY